jgi:hypothetical protein
MKNFLLQIWYKLQRKLTGSVPLDHYDIQEEEQFSEEQYRESIQETKRRIAEESKAKKNREVEFVWSLVGNIIEDHPVGENKEIRRGTKHFSAGTKVYCFPPQWGDGYEKIYVMGRPRQRSGFIKVVISSCLVTNWRIQKVFTPRIKREMIKDNGWDETQESKQTIEKFLKFLRERGVGQSRSKDD